MPRKDYSNLLDVKFNNLIIKDIFFIEDGKRKSTGNPITTPYAKCLCACGKSKLIRLRLVTTGDTKSCGCIRKSKEFLLNLSHKMKQTRVERKWSGAQTHNLTGTKIYRTYRNMLSRCYNSNLESYKNYGGRGIKVCDRWLEPNGQGFLNFLADMGQNMTPNLTLDRADCNGNYTPDNCRWATRSQQINNRRTTKIYTIDNATKTLIDWCRFYNLNLEMVRTRLKSGWSIEQALNLLSAPEKRRSSLSKYEILDLLKSGLSLNDLIIKFNLNKHLTTCTVTKLKKAGLL